MNWLGKSYAKLLRNLPPETLLSEDIEHNKRPENADSQNVLICGDNLEVLKHLKNAYRNSVKMIYIDPPYNTGSDGFVYQDNRKFTPEQLASLANITQDEAERILNFTDKGSNSHSAWLTFMYPRLYIARELLKDDGVIFISIDDNEGAQLKMLCDEVFGEGNFISQIVWERAYSPVNLKKHFSENHDFILCYTKNINLAVCNGLPRSQEANDRYANPDNDPRGVWGSSDLSVGPAIEQNIYEITTPTGRNVLPPNGYSWRLSKERFEEFLKDNRIWFGESGNNVPRIKRFLSETKQTITPMTIWKYQDVGHSQSASQELKRIFDERSYFTYPKPVNLVKRTLELYSDQSSLILDFFAGSGTTAHAVMQLNAEDGGNRRFIMVQLPEKTDKESEAFNAGYSTIFDITKARIEKSAVKIREENPNVSGDLGFKIYQTTENFKAVRDDEFNPYQAELPNLTIFTESQIQTLLTTWRVYDGAKLTEPVQAVDLGGYTAYLCNKRLYLLNEYFNSQHLFAFIQKLDNDVAFNPNRVIVFGTHMESAMQQELNQALASYSNRKNISLSLIVRN
ncbi:MAG: site-specific DNA-methyltransferase [Neisseriaceae bacterium]|nr:MAG: site-specific DNA-methyltransferase [Neisseriaceae bacterium]